MTDDLLAQAQLAAAFHRQAPLRTFDSVACPKCGAERGKPCRTKSGSRKPIPHPARRKIVMDDRGRIDRLLTQLMEG